ncbi:uncharacterized protein LY89DRAFT_745434 [Mollisia scopiformis]|uniref:Rhodopsin domain-containing protein n=1 Tax=Mollisia scopiformis TaxID=149040 RepID=A0A194XWV4_MOLSC|nr:uncharacterized protein LY89DRAFT_745434 [Mollisia scopiformis]KUJ24524.1 hypothetical protein LY89DRAFT_745434 [Mollisia scopiformis]
MNESTIDFWNIPAGRPPPGVVPNFVDPQTIRPVLTIGIYVLLPLMLSFVVARIYTRAFVTRMFGVDDCDTILHGRIKTDIQYECIVLNLKPISPLGRHLWDIPVAAITNQYLIAMSLVASPAALMFVKISILVFNYRIFQAELWARYAMWVGITVVTAFYLTNIIVVLAVCTPGHGETWLSKAEYGSCAPTEIKLAHAQGIFGFISDLYIVAIPLWIVSHLRLPTKRKAGVMVVFLTGFLLCEVCFGLIASCMPAITVSLKTLVTNIVSSWHSAKKYSNTLLSRPDNSGAEQLKDWSPEVPNAKMSGLRTFIRRVQRTNGQSVAVSELATLGTMNTEVEQDYHQQLRKMQGVDVERGS